MNQPALQSTARAESAETEEMRALRERVRAALTPEALTRFRERLEMSRHHEEERGSPGAFNGEVR